MLQKTIYSKLVQGLKKIKAAWDEDRKTNSVPYEIDSSISNLIYHYRKEIRESGDYRKEEEIVREFIEYQIKIGVLMKSPYGGTFFKIDTTNLPTREYFIKQVKEKYGKTFCN